MEWCIDRTKKTSKKIEEDIPDEVSYKVVKEILNGVGGHDWNDPKEVFKSFKNLFKENYAVVNNKDRSILTRDKDDKEKPFWIFQNVIRIDGNNRYVEGTKYNKLDIILNSEYFKNFMNKVAEIVGCTWNIRYGLSKNIENKLYIDVKKNNTSWLDKCVSHLVKDGEGINIKYLVLIEFKKNN